MKDFELYDKPPAFVDPVPHTLTESRSILDLNPKHWLVSKGYSILSIPKEQRINRGIYKFTG
jgi:hypothetical protein